ncbi:hypothetical protein AAC387_Pa02g0290 [Persea americana]
MRLDQINPSSLHPPPPHPSRWLGKRPARRPRRQPRSASPSAPLPSPPPLPPSSTFLIVSLSSQIRTHEREQPQAMRETLGSRRRVRLEVGAGDVGEGVRGDGSMLGAAAMVDGYGEGSAMGASGPWEMRKRENSSGL